MTPRNTSTGAVLEAMIIPALVRGGYALSKQTVMGFRLGGRRQIVDAVATTPTASIMISLKWQQVGGTAEQKVPFEVMCLADAVRTGLADKAYLVLGGDGWTLREYYISGALADHLVHAKLVTIVRLETFIGLANNGKL